LTVNDAEQGHRGLKRKKPSLYIHKQLESGPGDSRERKTFKIKTQCNKKYDSLVECRTISTWSFLGNSANIEMRKWYLLLRKEL
jgi:hypothetical protein